MRSAENSRSCSRQALRTRSATAIRDLTGAYSWWSYRFNARKNNAGWRIDYFIVSDRLRPAIEAAPIYHEIYGSDHCPVGLELKEELL